MTEEKVTDHVWRPPWRGALRTAVPVEQRPCCYMSCGRPRAEHQRATSGSHRVVTR